MDILAVGLGLVAVAAIVAVFLLSRRSAERGALVETLRDAAAELRERLDEMERDRETRDLVLSTMGEGVALIQSGDEIGYANRAARRLVGSMDGLRTLPPDLRLLVERAREAGEIQNLETERGAPPRILRATAVPVGGDDRVLLVLRDVTQARRLEATRRDFVAAASHELKTPTASIRASAETIREAMREDAAAAERFAIQLERDAVRLSRLVTDLLDLSRLESAAPSAGPVRLDAVAEGEVERFQDAARDAGVSLDMKVEPVTVSGDADDLRLMVANLLDNAVRYTGSGGSIRVQLRSAGGTVRLEVEDDGVGIPARDLLRVFERFYRVDRARSRDTGGTGLGLSIVRHVAERHGGRVEAESELGRGSVFRVTLPLAT